MVQPARDLCSANAAVCTATVDRKCTTLPMMFQLISDSSEELKTIVEKDVKAASVTAKTRRVSLRKMAPVEAKTASLV